MLLLFFILEFTILFFTEPDYGRKDSRASQADLPAQCKGSILVVESDLMVTFCQFHCRHGLSDRPYFDFFSIHLSKPVSVLGDRGIEQAVAVTGDETRNLRIGEFRQSQRASFKIAAEMVMVLDSPSALQVIFSSPLSPADTSPTASIWGRLIASV